MGGSVSLISGAEFSQTAAGAISTDRGNLLLQSLRGSVTQAHSATASSMGLSNAGSITLDAGAAIRVASLNAGSNAISLIARAGSVTDVDATQTDSTDLSAASVWIRASEDIGANVSAGGLVGSGGLAANTLELMTSSLSAQSAGSMRLANSGKLTVASISSSSGLHSTDGGDISLTVNGDSLTVDAAAKVSTTGMGQVALSVDNLSNTSVLSLQGLVSAEQGSVRLSADASVNLVASSAARLAMTDRVRTVGDVVVTAGNGLRIVDLSGNNAAGSLGRSDAPGVIRIVGDQTIASNQRLALQVGGEDNNQNDQLQVSGTLTLASGSATQTPTAATIRPAAARWTSHWPTVCNRAWRAATA